VVGDSAPGSCGPLLRQVLELTGDHADLAAEDERPRRRIGCANESGSAPVSNVLRFSTSTKSLSRARGAGQSLNAGNFVSGRKGSPSVDGGDKHGDLRSHHLDGTRSGAR
jgi:hypothetical protein